MPHPITVQVSSAQLRTDFVILCFVILFCDFIFRFRTALNVLGDAIGAGLVHHLSKEELAAMNEEGKDLEMDKVTQNGNTNGAFKDEGEPSSRL